MAERLQALDAFAGAGGWSVACAQVGIDDLGIENEPIVVQTRAAAGFETLFNDVWEGVHERANFTMPIFLGSPPCQAFSVAGRGDGRTAMDDILRALEEQVYASGRAGMDAVRNKLGDKIALVLSPMSYIWRDRPTFVALEQVPQVLPVWEAFKPHLERMGYSVEVGVLSAEQYGIVYPCAIHSQKKIAANAANTFLLETNPAHVRANATTPYDSELTTLARVVVADWATATNREDARNVTWLTRARQEAMRARSEPATLTGKAASLWTIVATSEFALQADTAASIESSWNKSLAGLSLEEKWSTMSTSQQTTTIRATLSCIVATPTTCTGIGPATRHVDCGLCLDAATPQTRRRAILVARNDGGIARLPKPTHSKYYARDPERRDPGVLPWVSMFDALGWGFKNRPALTVTGHGLVTRHPTGQKTAVMNALEAGTFTPRSPYDLESARKAGEQREDYLSLSSRYEPDAVNCSPLDNAILQTFPVGFPFQGTRTQKYLQIGNALPPLLAKAILEALLCSVLDSHDSDW